MKPFGRDRRLKVLKQGHGFLMNAYSATTGGKKVGLEVFGPCTLECCVWDTLNLLATSSSPANTFSQSTRPPRNLDLPFRLSGFWRLWTATRRCPTPRVRNLDGSTLLAR